MEAYNFFTILYINLFEFLSLDKIKLYFVMYLYNQQKSSERVENPSIPSREYTTGACYQAFGTTRIQFPEGI